MLPKKATLDWLEICVFSSTLALSALIGVYFGFVKKTGQDTIDGYLLGGKQMSLFPISMSLISSFISGIALLGVPAEIYANGINYAFTFLSYFVIGVLCTYVFLPVFFKLQLISLYEYMELRFDKFVRRMVSLLFATSLIFYLPIVIYGPALALNQVSDVGIHTFCFISSAICIFYTTLGGLKAVVWTDTIQGLVMYAAMFTVAAIGTAKAGGLLSVLGTAYEGGRMDVDWSWDPRLRATAWSVSIGFSFINLSASAVHPSCVQRFISMRTIHEARWSVLIFTVGAAIFCAFNIYMGLVLYSHYKDCDPLSAGMIQRTDQILPYFVADKIGNIPGLPGVFLAGIVCAALSTMSAGLNTLAGTVYEDFVEPVVGKVNEARAANILKLLVVVFGVISLSLVFVMEKLGSLVELYNGFAGPSAGTVMGIFVLGLFFPRVNSTGASVGGVFSLALMAWVIYGYRTAVAEGRIVYTSLPKSVDLCPFNHTLPFNRTETSTEVFGQVFPLFEVTIFYYCCLACVTAIVVGIVVSYLTGPNSLDKINRDLLSPLVHRSYQNTFRFRSKR